ncbi:uncharacterized protein LOC132261656 [Phlebotomus argentipes]|uniref:uncharacterized protein LOC132261656 n=1 Tax=Phlebotomus argentipes TaxID=94469 RepID=UPI002892E888|nr:uncharacterized protein LOC132261656 [Phlebotomus argentipes]
MAPVKFYFCSPSPPARFNLMAIKYMKLDVEIVVVDLLNGEQHSPEFLKLNPQHTIPTIDDNGFILWESRAIATYLVSSKAPGSTLYPTDVKKRALVDNRLYLDHELQMAFLGMVYPVYRMGAKEVSKSQKEKMYKALGNLNTFLEGQKYVAGSELTLADLALLATVVSIQEMGANVKKFNNITAWLKTLESVPGAQENLEGAQLFANFVKSMIDLKQTWEDSVLNRYLQKQDVPVISDNKSLKMAPLKFYHYRLSPPSRLVLLTIRNLKLDAEIVVVDLLKGEHLAPEFVKVNPQHTVPTIDDNGFVLWESRAIATYLVSSKAPGSSLYPTDVKKRAVVDARLYLDQELQIAFGGIAYPILALGATEMPKDKREKVFKILGNLNAFLEGQKYVAGSELTVADLALLSTMAGLQASGANLSKFSNVSAWLKSLESVPGAEENRDGAQFFGNLIKSKINLTGTWEA